MIHSDGTNETTPTCDSWLMGKRWTKTRGCGSDLQGHRARGNYTRWVWCDWAKTFVLLLFSARLCLASDVIGVSSIIFDPAGVPTQVCFGALLNRSRFVRQIACRKASGFNMTTIPELHVERLRVDHRIKPNKGYYRGSWHRYERSDPTLRTGLLAVPLGARTLRAKQGSLEQNDNTELQGLKARPPKSQCRACDMNSIPRGGYLRGYFLLQ